MDKYGEGVADQKGAEGKGVAVTQKCCYCYKRFKSKHALYGHMRTHSVRKAAQCLVDLSSARVASGSRSGGEGNSDSIAFPNEIEQFVAQCLVDLSSAPAARVASGPRSGREINLYLNLSPNKSGNEDVEDSALKEGGVKGFP